MFATKSASYLASVVLVGLSVALVATADDPPPPRLRVFEAEPADTAASDLARARDAAAQRFEAVTGLNLEANETKQLVIVDVRADSHAAKAGLQVGDVLVRVDNHAITDDESFAEYLRQSPAKSAYLVQVSRGGKPLEVIVGIQVETLGMSVSMDEAKRPFVQRVALDSPAADALIEAGDFIVAVNQEPTSDFEKFKIVLVSTLQKSRPGDEVRLDLTRGDETRTVAVFVPADVVVPVLDQKPKPVIARIAKERADDAVTATLFSTGPFYDSAVSVEAGFVGAVGIVYVRHTYDGKDAPAKSTVDVTIQNFPEGTYTLVAHRYGDLRNLVGGSSGLVNVVLDTIVVDQAGVAKVEGKPVNVSVNELAGHTVSLVRVNPETLRFDPSDEVARYEFNAFGVFGSAHPPIPDSKVILKE